MDEAVRKVLRTAQSYVPAIKTRKDDFYRVGRRVMRRPHEADFTIVFRVPKAAGEVLVDVGANHGQSIASLRLFDASTPIHSFEAHPNLAKVLTDRYRADPSVTVHSVGLGEERQAMKLYVPVYRGFVYDGLASLDRKEAAGWLSRETLYGFDPSKLDILELASEIETLDDHDLAPAFIKVDVQGLEYEVLAGGRATLERHHPILLVEAYDADQRLPDLLRDLGYVEHHVIDGRAEPGPGPSANALLIPADRPLDHRA